MSAVQPQIDGVKKCITYTACAVKKHLLSYVPMIHAPHIIKHHRTRSKFLRRHLNASKWPITANLGAALSGGTLDSADFFWLGYFDHPFSSGMMEAIHNKIGIPTRMASGDRDGDCLHLRTTPSMSQKA